MPQDNTKDKLKAESVVVAGDPLEAALSMKVADHNLIITK
jgi:hypothetical protein